MAKNDEARRAVALRELLEEWRRQNDLLFLGALRPPVVAYADAETRLGEWRPATRTMAISPVLVEEQPWGVVVEVLKHEMAHQYVSEVLQVFDEPPHGPAFRRTCERYG